MNSSVRGSLVGPRPPGRAAGLPQALTDLCVPHHQLGLGVLCFEVQQLLQGCGLDPGHTLPFETQLLPRSIFQPLENVVFLLCCPLLPKGIPIALVLSPQWDQLFH